MTNNPRPFKYVEPDPLAPQTNLEPEPIVIHDLPGGGGTEGPMGPKGDKGDPGDPGPKGDKGDTGERGLQGPSGADGPQGPRGPAGADGSAGPKGDPGDTGERGSDGLQGPKGDPGTPGAQGPKGDKGDQGIQGLQGPKGADGTNGAPGAKGDKGDPGAKGEPGQSITIAGYYDTLAELEALIPTLTEADAGKSYITMEFGHLHFWTGTEMTDGGEIVGPQGIQGPKGDTGAQGPKGDKGDPGPQGVKGADGTNGTNGAPGAKGDKGDPGDRGPQGIQGQKGDTGSQGLQGPRGADGIDGSVGPRGDQGPQGPKGDKGDTGERGLTGAKGDTGAQGAAGQGVPTGGSTGYYLAKRSATSYDTVWRKMPEQQFVPEFLHSGANLNNGSGAIMHLGSMCSVYTEPNGSGEWTFEIAGSGWGGPEVNLRFELYDAQGVKEVWYSDNHQFNGFNRQQVFTYIPRSMSHMIRFLVSTEQEMYEGGSKTAPSGSTDIWSRKIRYY